MSEKGGGKRMMLGPQATPHEVQVNVTTVRACDRCVHVTTVHACDYGACM